MDEASLGFPKSKSERNTLELLQTNEKKEVSEDGENLPVYPYERLMITAMEPVTDIDVTRREVMH